VGSDINKELGAAGAGVCVTLDGAAYTLSPLTQGMKANFSAWLAERARTAALEAEMFYRRKARRLRKQLEDEGDLMEPEEREEHVADIRDMEASAEDQMRNYNAQRAAGRFHFNDVNCQQVLASVEGSAKITQLMLLPKHPGLTFDATLDLITKYNRQLRDAIREIQNLGKTPPSRPDGQAESASESVSPVGEGSTL
jgi:hypothetical protein